MWSSFQPHRQIADLDAIKSCLAFDSKGIAYKVLNRGEHARYHRSILGILSKRTCDGIGDHVLQQQSALWMNQEDLLNTIHQAVKEDDFAKWLTGEMCIRDRWRTACSDGSSTSSRKRGLSGAGVARIPYGTFPK